MDWGVAGPGLAAALAGAAGFVALYRRPSTRPVTRSGYASMAFIVAFLSVASIAGALAFPSIELSHMAREAMSGVVEGYYTLHLAVEGVNDSTGEVNLSNPQAAAGLSGALLDASNRSSSVGASRTVGGCRVALHPYALAVMEAVGRGGGGYPRLLYGVVLVVDPHIPRGAVYLQAPHGLGENLSRALSASGLRVAGPPGEAPDPTLRALRSQCGGLLDCLLQGSPLPSGPPGTPGAVVVTYQVSRGSMAPPGSGFIKPVGPTATLLVPPSSIEGVIRSLALLGGNGTTYRVEGLQAGGTVDSLIIADLADDCYSHVIGRNVMGFIADTLRAAAPQGYQPGVLGGLDAPRSILDAASNMGTAGSMLSLALFTSILLASASPLAASGAVALARNVALLRLRGLPAGGLRRQLAAVTLSALLAGVGAGLLAMEAWIPGLRSYTGVGGLAGAVVLAVVTLLIMYRRAHRESSRVLVEAVARGHPLAVAPIPPPEGLGKLGWLSLILGLYHAARGYLGFTTFIYIDRHYSWFNSLSPALQALLVVWAVIEVFTAPFAPAMLAYAVAKLIAWKSPAIVSSRLVSRLLGDVAPAARGIVRLIAGRSMALVILAVFAASLLASVGLASGSAHAWSMKAAETAVSPGLLAVKPLDPTGSVTLRVHSASAPGERSLSPAYNLTVYDLSGAIGEARAACPGALVAVGLPAFVTYGEAGREALLEAAGPAGGGRLAIVYSSSGGLEELIERSGLPLSPDARAALYQEGEVLTRGSSGYSGYSSGRSLALLEPNGTVASIPAERDLGVLAVPGVDIIEYHANYTGESGFFWSPMIVGGWAWGLLPARVAYPESLRARPVIAVYTLEPDPGCAAALEDRGFHVYTPSQVASSPDFERASRTLEEAHPASFLVPTAAATTGLSLLAALLLAVDADREVRPFMALLRLRGAGPREGGRITLSLWGTLILVAVLVGVAAGLGVAEGALNLVSGFMGEEFRLAVKVHLAAGPTVTAVFTGEAARSLTGAVGAVAYPLLLALLLLAPLVAVSLRVFRGPISRWLER
jgi:hypothetical protein